MKMKEMKITKRSGQEVPFDITKIENAIRKASQAVDYKDALSEGRIKLIAEEVAGVCAALRETGKPLPDFPRTTAIGALAHYVAAENRAFQPMNVTFGIMEGWPEKVRGGKQARYEKIAERALATVDRLKQEIDRA